jgi:hypothetical protein
VVDLGQAQAGPDQHPPRAGPKRGPAGDRKLVRLPVPGSCVLEAVLSIQHQRIDRREVSHAVMMVRYPDRSGPHYASK